MVSPHDFVVPLKDIDEKDVFVVGVPSVNLSEGFVVTPRAYFKFLDENCLHQRITHLLGSINFDRHDSLFQVSIHIKNLIKSAKIPSGISNTIFNHYAVLKNPRLVTHISIISGDPNQAMPVSLKSTEVMGEATLIDTMRTLWSTLFNPELIVYRDKNNIDHLKTGIAITFQKI